jgi:hypothetical protein
MGDEDINLQPDELCRELGGASGLPASVADLQRDILTLLVAEIAQTSSEGVRERVRGRRAHEHADTRHLLSG